LDQIGIEKGKPFASDERMKKILTDAANIGAVNARTLGYKIRDKTGSSIGAATGASHSSVATSLRCRPGSATSTARSSSTFSPQASRPLLALSGR
jgi:hypothetical protein